MIRPSSSFRPTRSASGSAITTNKTGEAVIERPEDDMLEKINYEDLPRAQKRFVKQFEKVNDERIKEMFAKNYKNHAAFAVLISVAVGIYFYTMHAVRQETFLEEIDQEMAVEKPDTHAHLATKTDQ